MTLWELIDGQLKRRHELAMKRPINARLLANVIGLSLISSFVGALFALFWFPIPPGNEQVVTYMIGQLSGFAGGVVAYHYTMSAGAKELEAQRADNTGKAFEAIKAAAGTGGGSEPKPDVTLKPGETAQAAPATGDDGDSRPIE